MNLQFYSTIFPNTVNLLINCQLGKTSHPEMTTLHTTRVVVLVCFGKVFFMWSSRYAQMHTSCVVDVFCFGTAACLLGPRQQPPGKCCRQVGDGAAIALVFAAKAPPFVKIILLAWFLAKFLEKLFLFFIFKFFYNLKKIEIKSLEYSNGYYLNKYNI